MAEIALSQREQIVNCTEALPCPFCGSQPAIQPWHGGGPRKRFIQCPNLDCSVTPQTTGSTRQKALDAWNTRSGEVKSPLRMPWQPLV
jgi:hypothetical protein